MEIFQLFRTMEIIRKAFGGDYAPQQLSILLLVHLRTGIRYKEIGQILSMSEGAVSRNCKRLGRSIAKGHDGVMKEVGYGLVDNRKDVIFDNRRCIVYLTQEGRQLIRRIQYLIKKQDQKQAGKCRQEIETSSIPP